MSDLESIRKRLREHGYLGGPIERFVLQDAFSEQAQRTRIVHASFKATLLFAPLLSLWTATITANSPLVGLNWIEGLLLSLYDFLFLGPFCFLYFCLVGFVSGRLKAQKFPAWVMACSFAVMALMVLWWQRGYESTPLHILWSSLGAVLAGFGAWCAGLLSWLGGVRPDQAVPSTVKRGILWAATVSFAVLASLPIWRTSNRDLVDLQSWNLQPGPSLVVLGIDGMSQDMLPLVESLGFEIKAKGAWTRDPSLRPAALWTSMWTGLTPNEHGVGAEDQRTLPGMVTAQANAQALESLDRAWRRWLPHVRQPLSSTGRRSRMLWEIVSMAEPVVSVGWWSTWPARLDELEDGFVVSDRTLAKLLSGSPADRETWPPSYFQVIEQDFSVFETKVNLEIHNLGSQMPELSKPQEAEPLQVLRSALEIDFFHLEQLKSLRRAIKPKLATVYLPGLDILRMNLTEDQQEKMLMPYAHWLMEQIEALGLGDGTEGVLILADPGRELFETKELAGFWVAGGAGVIAGEGNAQTDLWFSQLLEWLGYPQFQETLSENRVLSLENAANTTQITTIPPPPKIENGTSEFDDEMLERLKSLGYVQ